MFQYGVKNLKHPTGILNCKRHEVPLMILNIICKVSRLLQSGEMMAIFPYIIICKKLVFFYKCKTKWRVNEEILVCTLLRGMFVLLKSSKNDGNNINNLGQTITEYYVLLKLLIIHMWNKKYSKEYSNWTVFLFVKKNICICFFNCFQLHFCDVRIIAKPPFVLSSDVAYIVTTACGAQMFNNTKQSVGF